MPDDIAILRWPDHPDPVSARRTVEDIFFAAAGRTFSDAGERDAFLERWLGRYLAVDADHAFLAVTATGAVVGYLVGALDDPSTADRFADIPYFRADFRHLCARFPAHFHINLAETARGAGTGSRLVAAFAAHAASAGARGVHVVTADGHRNVGFYRRNGFAPRGSTLFGSRPVVFLGRDLQPPLA